jgi:carboxypeptidase Q
MRRSLLAVGALVAVALAGATATTAQQADVFAHIRDEGLTRSHVAADFTTLTDDIGPRLTNSPGFRRAVAWAKDRLTAVGLKDVHTEPWPFGRGWTLDKLTVEMIEPRYMPLIGYAEAWSPSTAGEVTGTPVMIGGKSPADVAALGSRLKGAIVLTQPHATFIRENREQPTTAAGPVRIGAPPPPGPRQNSDDARKIAQTLRESGAAVLVRTSYGEHGTVFVQRRDEGAGALPAIMLAGEHYNLIARLVERGILVKLRVNVQSRYFTDDLNAANVIGDLPGTDPQLRDQLVVVGAHIDSWHTGTGAADNADGVASAIEAMRLIGASGARPRRTIRLALWGGEEQGLLGSKAYVERHFAGDAHRAERARVFVYLNQDPGTGPIYGWYLEDTPAVQPLFDEWLAPLKDLGARRNIMPGIGNTDHLSFRAVGIPGFNAIQDYTDYDLRIHHTNMDTAERVREQDLKQSAIVLAWFAYEASVTDATIARPEPSASSR